MFKKAIITTTPTGKFHFVGRVHADLCNRTFDTVADAKVAAIDVMISTGNTFPVGVSEGLEQ